MYYKNVSSLQIDLHIQFQSNSQQDFFVINLQSDLKFIQKWILLRLRRVKITVNKKCEDVLYQILRLTIKLCD